MQRPPDEGGESWADDDELAGEIDSVLGLDEDAADRPATRPRGHLSHSSEPAP